MKMQRNFNNMVNICADGLIDVITDQYEAAAERIDKWIGRYLDDTQIGVMAFNVNYHVSYVPVLSWDTAWKKKNGRVVSAEALKEQKHWSYKFVEAHEMDVEPYSLAIESVHKRGAQAWFSVRMNEYHYLNNELTASSFWLEHPEYRMGEAESFDYTHNEVREYYLDYIRELCERYDIDGLELDMLRGPVFFKAPRDLKILADFVNNVRGTINEISKRKHKNIRLSARVNINNDNNVKAGYDAVDWGKRGMVDLLTISNFFVPTTFYAPVKWWKDKMSNSDCRINVATDFCSFCTVWDASYTRYLRNNTETLKGFAANAFAQGADGIYTFNVMLEGFTKDVDLNLDVDFKEFSCYEAAIKGKRTHIYTINEQFPEISALPLKKSVVQIATALRPTNYYRIILGTDRKEIPAVWLNGVRIKFDGQISGRKFETERKNPPFICEPSETAAFVYQYTVEELEIAKTGVNEISFDAEGNIIWLQIDVGM